MCLEQPLYHCIWVKLLVILWIASQNNTTVSKSRCRTLSCIMPLDCPYKRYSRFISIFITSAVGLGCLSLVIVAFVGGGETLFLLCLLSCYFTSAWLIPLIKFLDSLKSSSQEIKPHWVFSAVAHLAVLLMFCGYVVISGIYSYITYGSYLWDDYFIWCLCIMVSIPIVSMLIIIPCMLVFDCKNLLPDQSHLPVRRQNNSRSRSRRNDVTQIRRAKFQKMFQGFTKIFRFKRTVHSNTTQEINVELVENQEVTDGNEEEINNLPSYDIIMQEGLPSYGSLKLKQISFGRKVLVVDNKLSMLTFDNTTSV